MTNWTELNTEIEPWGETQHGVLSVEPHVLPPVQEEACRRLHREARALRKQAQQQPGPDRKLLEAQAQGSHGPSQMQAFIVVLLCFY